MAFGGADLALGAGSLSSVILSKSLGPPQAEVVSPEGNRAC